MQVSYDFSDRTAVVTGGAFIQQRRGVRPVWRARDLLRSRQMVNGTHVDRYNSPDTVMQKTAENSDGK